MLKKNKSISRNDVVRAVTYGTCISFGILAVTFICAENGIPATALNMSIGILSGGLLGGLLGFGVLIIPLIQTSQRTITKAPGEKLLVIVDFLFRRTTVELTFKPLVTDWRGEYFEALKQDRKLKARWIMMGYRFRFACTFIKAIGLSKVVSFFKQIFK